MTITAAAQEHRALVDERAAKVAALQSKQLTQDQFDSAVKTLDARIGRLGQAHNPRIAVKALAWIQEN